MIKVQLPQGSIIEIDGSQEPKGIALRCPQQPALARILANLLDLEALPKDPDAELHVANKIIGHYRDARVIETSPEHYASRKPKTDRTAPRTGIAPTTPQHAA